MTRAQFLKKLSSLKGEFAIDDWGKIRCKKGDHNFCPLEACYYFDTGKVAIYREVGREYGMKNEMIDCLICGVDCPSCINQSPSCRSWRKGIKKALGLVDRRRYRKS